MSATDLISAFETPAKFIRWGFMALGMFFLSETYTDMKVVKKNTETLETRVSVFESSIAKTDLQINFLTGRVETISDRQFKNNP